MLVGCSIVWSIVWSSERPIASARPVKQHWDKDKGPRDPAPTPPPAPPPPAVPLDQAQIAWPATRARPAFVRLGGGTARSFAMAISGDGRTILGSVTNGVDELAVTWRAGKRVGTAVVAPIGGAGVSAFAISGNGQTIAGEAGETPVVWVNGVARPLPLPPDMDSGQARAVSRDGSVIGGTVFGTCSGTPCDVAVLWKKGKVEVLRDGTTPLSLETMTLSADGKLVIGTRGTEPFGGIRVSGGKVSFLGGLVRTDAVSGDGRAVAGVDLADGRSNATLWRGTRKIALGTLPGTEGCESHAISSDGRRVIGTCSFRSPAVKEGQRTAPPPRTPRPRASSVFLWDAKHGMRSLQDILVAANVLQLDFVISEAVGLSADGTAIVGAGYTTAGQQEAWLAIVPP